jgi:hypothetical protein
VEGNAAAEHGVKIGLPESCCYPSGHNGKNDLRYVAETKFSDKQIYEVESKRT